MATSAAAPALLLALTLAACDLPDTATVPLSYEPTGAAPVFQSHPVVAVGPVVDARAQPPARLGTATGQFGFPEETLFSEPSVARAVRDAFITALMYRGLLAPVGQPRFDLAVRVLRLGADEGWRRRAGADFVVTLTRHRIGTVVYREEVRAEAGASGRPYSLDTAAYVPVADVTELARTSMNRAIEHVLEDPKFEAALRG